MVHLFLNCISKAWNRVLMRVVVVSIAAVGAVCTACAPSVRFAAYGREASAPSFVAASGTQKSVSSVRQSSQPSSATQASRPDANGLESTDVVFYGGASFYGDEFQGRRTANGELFDQGSFSAAHRTLPFGTLLKVKNVGNDRSVIVRVNDRGPFKPDRVVDLSRSAAEELGFIREGTTTVEVVVMRLLEQ